MRRMTGGSPTAAPARRLKRFISYALAAVVGSALAVAGAAPGASTTTSTAKPTEAITSTHTFGGPLLEPLHQFEEALRRRTDFRALPPGDAVTGPDPYVVRALPAAAGASPRLVSILRGAAQVVVLDEGLQLLGRAATPRAPTGLAVTPDGDIFVSSEQSPEIARYRLTATGLQRTGTATVEGVQAIRDLATGASGILYGVDEIGGRLLTLRLGATAPGGRVAVKVSARAVGHGAIRVVRAGELLLVNCLLDHAVIAFRLGSDGTPDAEVGRVVHDGPIWSFDMVPAPAPGQGWLVVGGVEDHPLDRTGGSFGYIDSFLTVYRLGTSPSPSPSPSPPTRLSQINLSALGVVTPKVLSAHALADGSLRVMATGYGTPLLLTLTFPPRFDAAPVVATETLLPGTTSVVAASDGALVFADPLLDAWVSLSHGRTRVVPVRDVLADAPPADDRDELARVGEALLFTTLMAPWNRSDGPLSRFTCETCHFEMYGDGRTHHTGRGDVHATTKPLRGLFNNRPHFSRALDEDLATVANAEFRVAGAKSDHDPWFSVTTDDFPWLRALGVRAPSLSPLLLRKAVMVALMRLGHAPNPTAAAASGHWTDQQRAGALLFRERCESCHQARLVSDDPASRVPFDAWEALVLGDNNPLVWGQAEYRQTGVLPYVHEKGARVPSLRRLYKKHPYFTNGSAPDMAAVVDRARFAGEAFWHDGVPVQNLPQTRLDPQDSRRILAFLDLL